MPVLLDLRQVSTSHLELLLAEQNAVWMSRFNWDLSASSEMLIRLIRMQSLTGFALAGEDRVDGFCYYVTDERKGLIGDLFVTGTGPEAAEGEIRLLAASLRALAATPMISRVETQFLMLSAGARARLPYPLLMQPFERLFLKLPASRAEALPPRNGTAAEFYNWHPREHEAAARLIVSSYRDHVDARINDQYRSVAGSRKFIDNLLQYPGCGSFFEKASIIAIDAVSGKLIGLALASLVAYDSGHITQVCVLPEAQRRGLGFELVRRAATALAQANCRSISLTVTASNLDAVRLYDRMGFEVADRFEAFVWEGIGR